MENQQQRVKKFMVLAGQNCPEKPIQLDEATAKLRAALILEEALETITKGLGLSVLISERISPTNWEEVELTERNSDDIRISFVKEKEVDLVELADGIADVTVVTYGTAVAAGIDMEPIEKEVSDSNLSKAWKEDELNKVKELGGSIVEPRDNNLFIVKRSDGKVIKSPSYNPANLGPIIESQKV